MPNNSGIRVKLCMFFIVTEIFWHTYAGAFEVSTHRAITDRAAVVSNLQTFVVNQLGYDGGIDTTLSGSFSVRQWLQEGSEREDDDFRYFNHFHNPLRNWDQAGLWLGGESSVLWGQDSASGYDWGHARTVFYDALTASTKTTREQLLAETFRTVGQLVHLTQDAAVPAHTRNDAHPPWNPDGLEKFALAITGSSVFTSLTQTPTGFNPVILSLPSNALAKIPIARIIDTTDPEQSSAVPNMVNPGMAEYSNGNFLSRDTIFKDFVYPRIESIDLANPVLLDNRRYYTKNADGQTGFLLVAEGTFTERLLSKALGNKGFILDQRVHLDYASLLLPRAVDYSKGLINYFSRGILAVEISPDQSSTDFPQGLRVKISNNTAGDETDTGTIVGIIEVRDGGDPYWIVSPSQQVAVTRQPQEIDLTFSLGGNPSPSPEASIFLTIVYKGSLKAPNGTGEDTDGIAIGRISLTDVDVNPKDPSINCNDPAAMVLLTATGGIPPYTWETTKGTITVDGVNNEKGTFRPPPTNNLNVIAYWQKATWVAGLLWPAESNHPAVVDCQCVATAEMTPRKCDGTPFGLQPYGSWVNCTDPINLPNSYADPATWAYYPHVCIPNDCATNGHTSNPLPSPGCGPNISESGFFGNTPSVCGLPRIGGATEQYLLDHPQAGILIDVRTQQQKDNGCRPCPLEMQTPATVTVKDSFGTPVQTTVMAAQ